MLRRCLHLVILSFAVENAEHDADDCRDEEHLFRDLRVTAHEDVVAVDLVVAITERFPKVFAPAQRKVKYHGDGWRHAGCRVEHESWREHQGRAGEVLGFVQNPSAVDDFEEVVSHARDSEELVGRDWRVSSCQVVVVLLLS
jgi:hypothetical protein